MTDWGRWDHGDNLLFIDEKNYNMIPVNGPVETEEPPKKRDYIADCHEAVEAEEESLRSNYVPDLYSTWWVEEIRRQERLHVMHIKKAMDNLRRALRAEVKSGKELTEKQRSQLIMDPLEFISKTYVKISLADLYRRYRGVRIRALTECLAVVGNGTTQEANMKGIRDKIIVCGEAHKDSQRRHKQAKEERKS